MKMRRVSASGVVPAALALLLGLAAVTPERAGAQEMMDGTDARWMIRSHVSGVLIDGTSTELGLDVGDDLAVGMDITFFPTPKVGVNLLAAFISPEVTAMDDGEEISLGSVKALPPAMTVQYHFPAGESFRPYLGVGGSLVAFFDETGTLAEVNTEIDPGLGLVGQGGFNAFVADGIVFMADFRWVEILNDPEVTTDIGDDELDFRHFVLSTGIGFSF